MAKSGQSRKVDNMLARGLLGSVEYDPFHTAIGYSLEQQDTFAIFTQYMEVYESAVAFAKEDRFWPLPDPAKVQPKSPEWYAGMIGRALQIMELRLKAGDREMSLRARDAACALFGEGCAVGAAALIIAEGERKLQIDLNRFGRNRETRKETAERNRHIIDTAKSVDGWNSMSKKMLVREVMQLLPQEKQSRIERALRGVTGQRRR